MKRTILLTAASVMVMVIIAQLLFSCGGLSLSQPDRNNPNDPNGTGYVAPEAGVTAPSALTASGEFRTVSLSWVDNSADETGFVIERSADSGGSWSELHTTGADTVSWSDSGLNIETSFTYRVKAVKDSESSEYSNEASATTLPLWQTAEVDNANNESSYWETAIAITGDDRIFINYRKDNFCTSAWLNSGDDFGNAASWNGKTELIDAASGIYTDLLAYDTDSVVTLYNKQSSNVDGSYYDLLYEEFDGTQWTNEHTVDSGTFSSLYGAFNTGVNCVLSKNDADTYVSSHYLYYYYNPGMDWYYEIDTKQKTGASTWGAATQIDSDTNDSGSNISAADYGTSTWLFWEDSGSLVYYDGSQSAVDGSSAAGYGVASVFTSDGIAHVIYSFNNGGSYELRYKYYDGALMTGTTYSNAGNTGIYPAMTVDSNDRLHSVFRDSSLGQLVYRSKPPGEDWAAETIDVNGTFPDIAIDDRNLPVISYYDIDTGKVCVTRRLE